MPHERPHIVERLERHDRGDNKRPRQCTRPIRAGKGLLLRIVTGAQCGVNPNATSSYDVAADRPKIPLATLRKRKGVKESVHGLCLWRYGPAARGWARCRTDVPSGSVECLDPNVSERLDAVGPNLGSPAFSHCR
jgi:hypothetical protein